MASVLITGTSKGIGLETALAFARAGHQVYATMRNPSQSPLPRRDRRSSRIYRSRSPKWMSILIESVSEAIAAILKGSEPIDVLVNNAGVEAVGSVEELPLATFRAIMETNYFGALRCIQALLPQMRQRRSGCIINVSSVAGRLSCPPLTSYCASKWALEALTEGLAGEMKTFNVRVASVEPGIIATSLADRIQDAGCADSQYRQSARFRRSF